MILKRKLIPFIFLLWSCGEQAALAMQVDMKITHFEYEKRENKIYITRLQLRPGISSINAPVMDPPKLGKIEVLGLLEIVGNAINSCGHSGGLDSIDQLIQKWTKNNALKFGVIQIGCLSEEEKNAMKGENGAWRQEQLIQALRHAKYVSFGSEIYFVETQFDQFLEAFQSALRS